MTATPGAPADSTGLSPATASDGSGAASPRVRIGLGIDAHRFAAERPLVLAGVRVREHDGLLGHSDADVVTHAIMDALLGAAGLEDIGHYFPDTDPAFAGADSVALLGEVVRLLGQAGWTVANVDAVVVCEQPKIAPHRAAMRAALAAALGVTVDRVGVRGTTTETMGFTGRGEGILCQAVALVERVGPQPPPTT
jgi:2-C-methyl-D-erythritol 2,4-cyclodiphosphate synthase